MSCRRIALAFLACASAIFAATFGTAVSIVGGAADLALDEARSKLYLVNTNLARIEVYNTRTRAFETAVSTDASPLSCVISRNGKSLYVASYDAASLNIISLDTMTVSKRVSLPAKPEGLAVGIDERVLISTIGSGTNNTQNVLLLYDPNATSTAASLINVPVTPPASNLPTLPATSARPFLSSASQLMASPDGRFIIGVNLPNTANRIIFYYEVASATVLRSRQVTSASSVLAVSPDGTKFMAGLTLFNSSTFQVMAQQNIANSPYPIANGTNFNTQSAQGGSVFSPDGKTLYSAFDISPVQNPAAKPSVSEFMLSDPDNLLINMGLQLPENLQGKMVISRDGSNIYALSESGFINIPIGTMNQQPLAVLDSDVALLTNDQCGTTSPTARVLLRNAGRGQLTASAQVLAYTTTTVIGIGGPGGPGGGNPNGGFVITTTSPNTATAPAIRTSQTSDGTAFDLTYSTATAARTLGTVNPSHDLLIQSPQAINIPHRLRVYQNYRNTESRGDVYAVAKGISDNEALTDLVLDTKRQRVYISNSGMNRVEVFDTVNKTFLAPIKVGQLPRSIALSPDGNTLYVANTGGEDISIVDPDLMVQTGHVVFPPIPINTATAIVTPSILAASQRGLMFLSSTGQLWSVVGNNALPRGISKIMGSTAAGLPLTISTPRAIAATPGGERIIVAAGTGYVYLYDALADDFIQARQIFSGTQTGYAGPVSAGPKGAYYLVNGYVLNEALTAIYSPPSQGSAGTTATTPIPVAAVTATSPNQFVRFMQTVRTAAQAADPGTFDIIDLNSGNSVRSTAALEAPLSQAVTGRSTAIDSRTIAVDSTTNTVYAITQSGLSVLPLDVASTSGRPAVTPRGVVNAASYQTAVAPNALISIFGSNLADSAQASQVPLPTTLGNTCVTLNGNPIPLIMTSPGQINAQIPPNQAAGNYTLLVRAVNKKLASANYSLTVSRYAPAVLVDPASGQIALYHQDGRPVTKDNKATRDEPLTMYALGLGATTGGPVSAGNVSPTSPLAVTAAVQVFFGNYLWQQAPVIVDWSGLVPGFIGLYQLNLRVPGYHVSGDSLPVTIKIGGVYSPTSGPLLPTVSVD